MNYHKLAWHGLIFVFYSASIVLFYYFFYKYVTDPAPNHEDKTTMETLLAWIITTYMNFAVQIAMIVIFLQLKSKRRTENEDVLVSVGDERSESDVSIERINPRDLDEDFIEEHFNLLDETFSESEVDDKSVRKSENSTLQSEADANQYNGRASRIRRSSEKSAISAFTKAPS